MEPIIITGIVLAWLAMGFYGALTSFRCVMDINLHILVLCLVASVLGPVMFFIGMVERYQMKNKIVFFKKFEE